VPNQRLAALKQANEVRRRRAETKRALRTGEVAAPDLLAAPPEFLLSAGLAEVLLAIPGYGKVRVNQLLRRCRISPLKTIGGLSDRQRRELARLLSAASERQ
jgi:hypothetical protein